MSSPPPPTHTLPLWTGAAVLLVGLVALALVSWLLGLRVVVGALLLYDIRPPRMRDPWLPPPINLLAHLPTRTDLMS